MFKNLRFTETKGDVIEDSDEYFDDIKGMDAAEKALKAFPHKHTNFFSKVYEKITPNDISPSVGDMMAGGTKEKRAFAKLNAMSNFNGGTQQLNMNPALKGALKLIMNDDSKERDDRVLAAKLTTRITGVPVTIQRTQPEDGKPHKILDSYIIVPRVQRIFRPDKYVENYKAGNWGY